MRNEKEIIDAIVNFENEFLSAYVDFIKTDFGALYFDEQNPSSYDSNHAIILNYENLPATLRFIKSFYRTKHLIPRIYGARNRTEPESLFKSLRAANYTVNRDGGDSFFVYDPEMRRSEPRGRLEFTELKSVDPRVVAKIYDEPENGENRDEKILRQIKVFERMTQCPAVRWFVGYNEGDPVVSATLQKNRKDFVRVDHVETSLAHRNRGFATELVYRLISEFENMPDAKILYLYSSVPQAIRIYQRAGFTKIAELDGFSARCEESAK